MIQKFKNKIVILVSLFTLLAPVAVTATAYAVDPTVQDNINNSLKCGSDVNLSNANSVNVNANDCPTNTGGPESLSAKIKKIINILSAVIAIIAVIMIIIGGARYVASGGKQESITAARNTILYALVGLVIVALAQAVVHFVLNNVT